MRNKAPGMSDESQKDKMLLEVVAGKLDINRFANEVETQAQLEFNNSEVLPKAESVLGQGTDRAALEYWGVVFHDLVTDDLFVFVDLPTGWRKQATDHPMWTDLLDDQGRKRASIFYKGSFWDRRAFIRAKGRYEVYHEWPAFPIEPGDKHRMVIRDGGQVVHVLGAFVETDRNDMEGLRKSTKVEEELKELGKAWLDKHHPGWEDVAKSWEA